MRPSLLRALGGLAAALAFWGCPPQLTTPLVTLPTTPAHLGAPVAQGHVELGASGHLQTAPHLGPAAAHPLEQVGVMVPAAQLELSLRWGVSRRTELGLLLSRTAGPLTASAPDVREIPEPGHSGALLGSVRHVFDADGELRWAVGAHMGPTLMEVHHWSCEVACEDEAQCLEDCGDFHAYEEDGYSGALAWVYGGHVAALWEPLEGTTLSPWLGVRGHPVNVADHLDPDPAPEDAGEDEGVHWAVDHIALAAVVTYGFRLEHRWAGYRAGIDLYHPVSLDPGLPLSPVIGVNVGTVIYPW